MPRHRCRATRSTPSRKPGARTTSSTALPAAQASGLPPIGGAVRAGLQVLRHAAPWPARRRAGSRRRCPWPRTSRPARCPPIGAPRACRSGPCRSAPRPAPAGGRTRRSSARRSRRKSQRRRDARRPRPGSAPRGCRRSPASMASRTAFMLPKGTWSKPSTGGPKPARYFALPVAASMASVRPWKAPSKQMVRKRSGCPFSAWYFRTALIMPSFASAPELQKKTLSAKEVSDQPLPPAARPAARGTGCSRASPCAACSAIACTRCGWPWPRRRGGDAGAEIEESSPVRRPQPGALAPLEGEVGTVVGRHQGGDHG